MVLVMIRYGGHFNLPTKRAHDYGRAHTKRARDYGFKVEPTVVFVSVFSLVSATLSF